MSNKTVEMAEPNGLDRPFYFFTTTRDCNGGQASSVASAWNKAKLVSQPVTEDSAEIMMSRAFHIISRERPVVKRERPVVKYAKVIVENADSSITHILLAKFSNDDDAMKFQDAFAAAVDDLPNLSPLMHDRYGIILESIGAEIEQHASVPL